MEGVLRGIDGIERLGFVAPDELPAVLARASCLVLPSRYEPWGVVVHEATTARMAVITTTACGAAIRLVLPGGNGTLVAPGDAPSLSRALVEYSNRSEAERLEMAELSAALATQFSPERWASTLVGGIESWRTRQASP